MTHDNIELITLHAIRPIPVTLLTNITCHIGLGIHLESGQNERAYADGPLCELKKCTYYYNYFLTPTFKHRPRDAIGLDLLIK